MKAKVLYKEAAPGQTFDWLTVKETGKSFVVVVKTNWQGGYDREYRYRKTQEMAHDIDYLCRTEDSPWFYHYYIEGEFHQKPYWRHERMIY